jgi:RNA polymerase sigma factor (sigma-70 family)
MPDSLSDDELVQLARGGDATALGLLLTRHQAGMHAVALAILGPSPDADDAVQDASLVALRRIGDLRDPAAAGAWLRAIVRNACKAILRQRQAADLALDDDLAPVPAAGPSPEEILDRHALRDWIWRAAGELSPPLQAALVLRYFSHIHSYTQIAALCGVPVGTVRSRLNQARAAMSQNLLATADMAHGDSARLIAARHQDGVTLWDAFERGEASKALAKHWSPDVTVDCFSGPVVGRRELGKVMYSERATGIRQRLERTIASQDLTIWQNEASMNDFSDSRQSAQITWVLYHRSNLIWRVSLYFTGFPAGHPDLPASRPPATSYTSGAPVLPALPSL